MRDYREPIRLKTFPAGHRNAGCYLSFLGGCDAKISNEHLVPASFGPLESFDPVNLSGQSFPHPWPLAKTAKVLCRRHNSMLHSFDDTGKRVFDAIMGTGSRTAEVNGHDFERFLLQRLCARHFGGMITVDAKRVSMPFPRGALERHFLLSNVRPDDGLYIVPTPSHLNPDVSRFELAPGFHEGELVGCRISLNVISFGLMLIGPVTLATGYYSHRPSAIEVLADDGEHLKIVFHWLDGAGASEPFFTDLRDNIP